MCTTNTQDFSNQVSNRTTSNQYSFSTFFRSTFILCSVHILLFLSYTTSIAQITDLKTTELVSCESATFSPPANVISVTQTDFLLIDHNQDGFANPQETIRYTIYIENKTTTDFADVIFQSDINTNCVIGSVMVSDGEVISGNNIGERQAIVRIDKVKAKSKQVISYDMVIPAQNTTQVSCQGMIYSKELGTILTDDINDPRTKQAPTVTIITPITASIICSYEE